MKHTLKRRIIAVVLLVAFSEGASYLMSVWIPSYLSDFLGISEKVAYLTNMLTLIGVTIFSIISGYLSGILGYRSMFLPNFLTLLRLIYPLPVSLPSTSSFACFKHSIATGMPDGKHQRHPDGNISRYFSEYLAGTGDEFSVHAAGGDA